MNGATRPQLAFLQEQIEEMKAKGVFFRLRVLEGEQKAVANFDGKEVINLSSNNYLGLTTHRALRRAALDAIRRYGVGAGAVRTIAGTMRPHIELEEQIARFKGTEACVVFQSGFTANAGTVAAILGKDDLILSDELNHASIIDGCRLSRAAIRVFKHRDMADCERLCRETADWPGHKLLISDGVFSMDGDIAPLPELCELAEKYNCIMMVDDAHASGVLGKGGRGTVDHFGCQGRVDIQVGTLSKAVGAMGGYVCGSRTLIEFLHHRARPFLFSTGASALGDRFLPGCVHAARFSRGRAADQEALGQHAVFPEAAAQAGIFHGDSQTPITPILVGEAAKAFEFSRLLFEAGVFAPAVGFPTVPEGKARLRAMVTATHKRADLERACDTMGEVGRRLGIVS